MRSACCLLAALVLGCGDDEGSTTSDSAADTTTTDATTDATTTTAADTTTGADACADKTEAACMSDTLCRALLGRPILDSPDGYCVGPEQFLGCSASMGCGSTITYACPPDSTDTFVFTTLCIPEGWTVCEPPANLPPECP